MDKFWTIKAMAGRKAELYLYGEISSSEQSPEDITPSKLKDELATLGDITQLDCYVNSPGGSIFAGFTVYNILKRYNAEVIMHVDGIAASAASFILMAGKRILMAANSTIMVHCAHAVTCGNKTDIRKMADTLQALDGQMADIYAERTGQRRAAIVAMMEAETWMDAKAAQAAGFCDAVEGNKRAVACSDLEKYLAQYKHTPQSVADLTAQRRTFDRIKRKILLAD